MVMSVVVQKPIPWLATAYKWTNGAKSLVITIRDGVKWSDGQPFTAKDVVFTMTYGKVDPAADQIRLQRRDQQYRQRRAERAQ